MLKYLTIIVNLRMKNELEKINKEAIKAMAKVDASIESDRAMFEALARLTVSVAFETVALRNGKNGVEIFLTKRGPDEAHANQWHSPGSVLRREEDFQNVFDRLAECEFQVPIISKKFIGLLNYQNTERGHFFCPVFLVELEQNPETGEWFSVNNLPVNIVNEHKNLLIPKALESFIDPDKPIFFSGR